MVAPVRVSFDGAATLRLPDVPSVGRETLSIYVLMLLHKRLIHADDEIIMKIGPLLLLCQRKCFNGKEIELIEAHSFCRDPSKLS